jgi:hypothetical protein
MIIFTNKEINLLKDFVSSDSPKYTLSGMYASKKKNNKIEFVACDGKRMVTHKKIYQKEDKVVVETINNRVMRIPRKAKLRERVSIYLFKETPILSYHKLLQHPSAGEKHIVDFVEGKFPNYCFYY